VFTVFGGADDVSGGAGTDTAIFNRIVTQPTSATGPAQPAAFTISLDDQPNDGRTGANEGVNVHSDVEDVSTGDGNDNLTGSWGTNDLSTGDGNDTVDPGPGADRVDAGAGDDTIRAQDEFTDQVACGDGRDSVNADLAGAQPQRADALSDCETVTGRPFPAVMPPPDTIAPKVRLSAATIRSRVFLREGILRVSVTCNEPCAVRGEAFTTSARIARVGQFSVATAALRRGTGKRTLKLRIAPKYLKAFKPKLKTARQRRKGLRFTVTVAAQDAARNTATRSVTVRVKG
jgi:hypothetical protein